MAQENALVNALIKAKNENNGTVTYHFEDGTSQTNDINKEMFFDEKNKPLHLSKVAQKFNDISHDLHAKYYRIN